MARPRKSLEALKLSGTFSKNPGRYSNRHEPADDRPVGEPYEWLSPDAQAAWRDMVPSMPWLRRCHRGIVGITAYMTAKMVNGELGVAGMNALRQCLGKLGATPADSSRVNCEPSAPADAAEKYYS